MEPVAVHPTVLIVEDSRTTAQIIAMTLRRTGCEIVCVTSVQEAQAALREAVPNLVVVDIELPDDSGLSVCKTLRTNPSYAQVRIVLITGLQEAKMVLAQVGGAYDAFFEKPFNLKDFAEKVRTLLALPA